MHIILIAITAGIATCLGGMLALRFKDKLHLIVGFSAGAVIGVTFFDLLPESLELGATFFEIHTLLLMTAIGFLSYLILDRLFISHSHDHMTHTHDDENATDRQRTNLRAGSLSLHSLLDGLGIGLSFQVSPELGTIVTIAVLAHDFSDGINTIGVVLKNGGTRVQALRWLLADSIAPIIGVVIAYFIPIPEKSLSILLSLFAGFFLYIGASDLIPESYHGHPTKWTTLMTVVGAGVIYLALTFAGH